MGIEERWAIIERRRGLALILAARPRGVMIRELARRARIPRETARDCLEELVFLGRACKRTGKAPRKRSPGRPPVVFHAVVESL